MSEKSSLGIPSPAAHSPGTICSLQAYGFVLAHRRRSEEEFKGKGQRRSSRSRPYGVMNSHELAGGLLEAPLSGVGSGNASRISDLDHF